MGKLMKGKVNRRAFVAGLGAVGAFLQQSRATASVFAPPRFTVEVVGSGPDVILIHGLNSSRRVWQPVISGLTGYRYHLVQLGGFAGAAAAGNASGLILPGVAEELSAYISKNRLDRPAVIGHSMGGTIAMLLALQRPSRVGKLMVVDMLPQPSGMVGGSAAAMRPLADNLRSFAQTSAGRDLMASLVGMFGAPGAARGSDPDVVGRSLHELATLDLSDDLRRLRVPITVVYASPSARQGEPVDRVFADAYRAAPRATFVRIDRSSHMIMADRPAEFRSAMRKFLTAR